MLGVACDWLAIFFIFHYLQTITTLWALLKGIMKAKTKVI